ncbi:MAG: hypothetical protein ACXAEB_01710 [Candidatus Thorarchaeota archaeon]|jgi:predicted  nucleic acid-binding Zn-ribbon protein
MSHGEGHEGDEKDYLYMDMSEVLSQYSVEWVALRKSFTEIKQRLEAVKVELTELDQQLERKEITEAKHIENYKDKWLESTAMVQVKREVEARLYEIQKEIRAANKQLKEQETVRRQRERVEQEKSNAMIEWMALKQGFELVEDRRRSISREMDSLELKRRESSISEEKFRKARLDQIRGLTELSIVESDVKRRLAELLDVIRK